VINLKTSHHPTIQPPSGAHLDVAPAVRPHPAPGAQPWPRQPGENVQAATVRPAVVASDQLLGVAGNRVLLRKLTPETMLFPMNYGYMDTSRTLHSGFIGFYIQKTMERSTMFNGKIMETPLFRLGYVQ
jgi:hypothetical protein